MHRLLNGALALGLATSLIAIEAKAQTEIPVGAGKPFKHQPSGVKIAPSAGGIQRASVVQYDDKQLDVAIDFRTPDNGEATTVYLFRNVTGDVPLWFDRIQKIVEGSEHLGEISAAIPIAAFTPAGQRSPNGLRAAYTVNGNNWASSAAALSGTADWYVAIRASSRTLTPQQLLTRIDQTYGAIKWPANSAALPVAVPIGDCAKPLAQRDDAKPIAEDMESVMLASALTATVAASVKKAVKVDAPLWCRDSYKVDGGGVYRPDGATDRFLIAYQDAGRGLWVAPNGLAGILQGAKSNADPSWMVEFIEIDRHDGYGSFQTLPNVAQALSAAKNGTRTYSASTWGKKDISIAVPAK